MNESSGPGGPAEPGLIPESASQLEPTTDAVPTSAVAVLTAAGGANAPSTGRRRRSARWAIAAVVTAVVIVGSTLGFAVLSSARSTSQVLPWAPSDAVVYTEVRADLPGDQRANLLAFLSKFPGFADQTSFDAKADDALDRLVKRLTNGKHDFSTEIKPWFGGQMGVSIEGTDPSSPGVLVVVSVRDATAAAAWLTSITPADASHQTYQGIDLVGPASPAPQDEAAYGLDGSVILAGTLDAVKTAITRGPSGDLAGGAGFQAAQDSLGGDDLGSVFIDVKGYISWLTGMESKILSGAGGGTGLVPRVSPLAIPTINTALLPGWVALEVRAESDYLVLDAASPTVAIPGLPARQNRQGALAASLPSNTVLQYDLHDVGSLAQAGLTQLEAQPGGPTADQVDAVAKYLGGVDAAVGWMGDADVVVTHDGSGFSGGLVLQTTDSTASGNLLTELKNLVTLGGAVAQLTVRTESYAGQTITVVDGDLGQLMGAGGTTIGGSSGKLELAFTQASDRVIVGIGDGFVKAVLDTKPGSSLADQAGYQHAIDLVGSSNVSQAYLDLTTVRTAIEALAAGSSGIAAYDSDVKPFLEPIQSIALSYVVGADVSTGRIVLVLQ
jgi:hypothetical protein